MKKRLTDYLRRLEQELAMSGYHDGWCLAWIREKIEETKNRLKWLTD
jgi:hypothetical protein